MWICESFISLRLSHFHCFIAGTSIDDLIDVHADGAVSVFESTDPRCSYVRLQNSSNVIMDIHEKLAVSNTACTGIYYWKRASDFFTAARVQLKRQIHHNGMYFLAPTYNEAIRAGLKFKAVCAKSCWSVRNLQEVEHFAESYVSTRADESLKRVYDEMAARQQASIESHGFTFDATLSGEQDQRCLAAYTLCTFDNFQTNGRFDLLMGQLQDIFSEGHVVYGLRSTHVLTGQLHMTMMQLVGFKMFGTIPLPADYTEVAESIFRRFLHPFEVHFNRIIVTRSNVLLVGNPTIGLNHIREEIRRALSRIGYPLYEPFKSDIAHMTLLRFAKPLSCAQQARLAALCAEFGSSCQQVARLSVNHIDISVASWKMQATELQEHNIRRVSLC